jgi:glutaredoxin-like protein
MEALRPKDLKWLEQTLANLQNEVTIIYFTEEVNCRHCRQERDLLADLADLSHKLHLEVYNFTADRSVADEYGVDKVPGFILLGKKDYGIKYYGMPSEFEFRMLLDDILQISSGKSGLSPDTTEKMKNLNVPLHLEVLTTPGCALSAPAVRIAHQLAMESDMVKADLVNVDDFPEVAKRYNILAAPTVVVNGSYLFYGALQESEFVENVIKGAQESST